MTNKCCKDCPDRVLGCHENCEKYAEFCKQNEKEKEIIKSAKQQFTPFYIKRKRHL